MYLIYGYGITGKATAKTLSELKLEHYIYDTNKKCCNKERKLKFLSRDQVINTLDKIDTIIKSPGIKPDDEILLLAEKKGIEIISDLELAFRLFANKKYICITGTNGKTTTSSLIAHILDDGVSKVHLCGNIGVGLLWEIFNASDEDYCVIETSSFQLHNIVQFCPKIAVLLNITPDHLDWHKTFENYVRDKLNLFQNLDDQSAAVINGDDPVIVENLNHINGKKYFFSIEKRMDFYYNDQYKRIYDNKGNYIDVNQIKLKGKHNIQNILAAYAAASILGFTSTWIGDKINSFKPIEHRIEFVKRINGVEYYNDSKGTNPDSTIKAIESFDNILLIAGGYDKKVDFTSLFESAKGRVKALFTIGDTKAILDEMAKNYNIEKHEMCQDLEEAVKKAKEYAIEGDTVLLSPASASWGMYNNYEERGRHFKQLVSEL